MIKPLVPIRIRGIYSGDAVKCLEELDGRRSIEVRSPVRIVTAHTVGGVQVCCSTARISWLKRVDAIRLDKYFEVGVAGSRIHAHDKLTRDLRRDHIISHPVSDLAGVICGGYEFQKRMIDTIKIPPMLPRVIESAFGDLWELAGPVKALWGERVRWRSIDLPVDLGSMIVWYGDPVVEQCFVVALP